MYLWSTCVRVLLSLGLILNGSSFAMAASAQVMHQGAGAILSADAAGEAVMPCHDVESTATTRSAGDPPAHAKGAPSAKSGAPDCCKSGTCNCACVHFLAVIPSVAFLGAAVFGSELAHPIQLAHNAPVLPHLSRPPIS